MSGTPRRTKHTSAKSLPGRVWNNISLYLNPSEKGALNIAAGKAGLRLYTSSKRLTSADHADHLRTIHAIEIRKQLALSAQSESKAEPAEQKANSIADIRLLDAISLATFSHYVEKPVLFNSMRVEDQAHYFKLWNAYRPYTMKNLQKDNIGKMSCLCVAIGLVCTGLAAGLQIQPTEKAILIRLALGVTAAAFFAWTLFSYYQRHLDSKENLIRLTQEYNLARNINPEGQQMGLIKRDIRVHRSKLLWGSNPYNLTVLASAQNQYEHAARLASTDPHAATLEEAINTLTQTRRMSVPIKVISDIGYSVFKNLHEGQLAIAINALTACRSIHYDFINLFKQSIEKRIMSFPRQLRRYCVRDLSARFFFMATFLSLIQQLAWGGLRLETLTPAYWITMGSLSACSLGMASNFVLRTTIPHFFKSEQLAENRLPFLALSQLSTFDRHAESIASRYFTDNPPTVMRESLRFITKSSRNTLHAATQAQP